MTLITAINKFILYIYLYVYQIFSGYLAVIER